MLVNLPTAAPRGDHRTLRRPTKPDEKARSSARSRRSIVALISWVQRRTLHFADAPSPRKSYTHHTPAPASRSSHLLPPRFPRSRLSPCAPSSHCLSSSSTVPIGVVTAAVAVPIIPIDVVAVAVAVERRRRHHRRRRSRRRRRRRRRRQGDLALTGSQEYGARHTAQELPADYGGGKPHGTQPRMPRHSGPQAQATHATTHDHRIGHTTALPDGSLTAACEG